MIQGNINRVMSNNAINADGQKRRFALLLPAGYGESYARKGTLANPENGV